MGVLKDFTPKLKATDISVNERWWMILDEEISEQSMHGYVVSFNHVH